MSKSNNKPECVTYADAENLMIRMDAMDRKIGKEQADMDAVLTQAERHSAKIKEMMKDRKALFEAMEKFALTRKGLDFTGEGESLRQRALGRGVIGFRLSPPAAAALSRDWTQAKILAAIKDLLRTDPAWKRHAKAPLIRVKESLNKDALKDLDLPAADLAKAGMAITQDDLFFAETAYQRELKETEKAKRERGKAA
ncbi:MAG: host-nuclease inhibitor Gam family protein [Planctomycetota bacterium]